MMDMRQGHTPALGNSVIPAWFETLSFQQQSVLLVALRGPDGVRKHHPAKKITISFRATILRAAMRGRFLNLDEDPDSFMSFAYFTEPSAWFDAVKEFFNHVDELPHHYVAHIAHASQILAVHHPDSLFQERWGFFYARWCDDLHVNTETPEEMKARLGDWGMAAERLGWNKS